MAKKVVLLDELDAILLQGFVSGSVRVFQDAQNEVMVGVLERAIKALEASKDEPGPSAWSRLTLEEG